MNFDSRTEEDKARDRAEHNRKKYGSNIPLAREQLLEIAGNLRWFSGTFYLSSDSKSIVEYARRIEAVVGDEMHQRKPIQHTRSKNKMTPTVKACILSYRGSGLSEHEVGEKCGTNSGRVSETWNGI